MAIWVFYQLETVPNSKLNTEELSEVVESLTEFFGDEILNH